MLEDQPIDREREAYLAKKRIEAMVVPQEMYDVICAQYLGLLHSLTPAVLHAQALRLKDGRELIVIDHDQFQSGFGQDLTSIIPYVIEHEAQELWLTRDSDSVDPYGPAHYEAIKQSILKAHRDGNLANLMESERLIYKTFDAIGDTRAMEELDFYKTEAAKLTGEK